MSRRGVAPSIQVKHIGFAGLLERLDVTPVIAHDDHLAMAVRPGLASREAPGLFSRAEESAGAAIGRKNEPLVLLGATDDEGTGRPLIIVTTVNDTHSLDLLRDPPMRAAQMSDERHRISIGLSWPRHRNVMMIEDGDARKRLQKTALS
ncbi:hypothetical protein ACFOEZ_10140 [Tianweitania populi]|uniref:hypothetical protein n=1 Tax=Tianweitania populi TaxID=1607949 RepID=UPI001672B46D|nr:hypothetical protein [Tianweitania populi]